MDLKVTNESKHISQTPEVSSRFTPEQKAKLAKASMDFESLLTSMMLKSMTKNTSGGLFGEEGYGGDVFESMFQSEISSYVTKYQSLGVAGELYKKITGEDLPNELIKQAGEPVANFKPGKIHAKEQSPPPSENVLRSETSRPVNTKNSHPAVEPSTRSMKRLDQFDGLIDQASKKYGIDSNIIKSVILAESAGNEKAQSVSKAKGLMQLMDSTARSMGVKNVWDPKENINGGTKYLADLLRQYNGDLHLALAAYNAGPGNVEKYKGVPPFSETKTYITRVLGYLNHLNG